MEINMKVNLKIIIGKVKVLLHGQKEINMKVNLKMVLEKEKEFIIILMAIYMMEIGFMEIEKVKANLFGKMEILLRGNGKVI